MAAALKAEGNKYFAARDYENAIAKYSEAINIEPSNHIFYSNRCAAFSGKGDFEAAARDAQACIQLCPSFVKGYFRLGSALKESGDYVEAEKACNNGLRVQADHADLLRLRTEIQSIEKASRSTMSAPERLKAEGNECFKNSDFEGAIAKYSAALDKMSDRSTPLAIACLNNRAACYQQHSNFSAVISDTTEVIDADPANVKALLRRGLAFEGLERYRSALADIREVLRIDPSIDMANRAQHRLGQAVRSLKAAKNQGL